MLKPIPGYPKYAACEDGYIWRIAPASKSSRSLPYRLKAAQKTGGYLNVTIYDSTETLWSRRVNRLVAMAWIGLPPSPDADAAHWDGNRQNNRPSNLRWCSKMENAQDRHRHGTVLKGEGHPGSKLTVAEIREMRDLRAAGALIHELAARFGIGTSTAHRIVMRTAWTSVE